MNNSRRSNVKAPYPGDGCCVEWSDDGSCCLDDYGECCNDVYVDNYYSDGYYGGGYYGGRRGWGRVSTIMYCIFHQKINKSTNSIILKYIFLSSMGVLEGVVDGITAVVEVGTMVVEVATAVVEVAIAVVEVAIAVVVVDIEVVEE